MKSWKWCAGSRWCIYRRRWWILCVNVNQLSKVASASSFPASASCQRHSLLSCLPPLIAHLSTPLVPSPLCNYTFASQSPCSSNPHHRSLTHPALIYCPHLPLRPIYPHFLPATSCLSSPPLLLRSLHPSDWVMAIRAGSHPAAVENRHWSHTQSL